MPKASTNRGATDAVEDVTKGVGQVNLRRNKACQQCRKRKLKCDAKLPACSTCMKSHGAVIAAKVIKGEPFELYPECTYKHRSADEDILQPAAAPPQNHQPRAPSTIGSLAEPSPWSDLSGSDPFSSLETNLGHANQPSMNISSSNIMDIALSGSPNFLAPRYDNANDPPHGELLATNMSSPASDHSSQVNIQAQSPLSAHTGSQTPPSDTTMSYTSYSPSLPPQPLLHHLVHTFFTCIPFSSRVLHRPSFLAALMLSPSSPAYPSAGLLHAICALASLYSSAIEQMPLPDLKVRPAHEVFLTMEDLESEQGMGGRGTFGAEQAAIARAVLEFDARVGKRLWDVTRATVILGWYHYANARWVDCWTTAATSMRFAVPLGLNVSSSMSEFSRSLTRKTILPPPTDPAEQEARRNLFWMCFLQDRYQQIATGWAGSIDEQDIGQDLPLPIADFESQSQPHSQLQNLNIPDLFTNHPPDLTDSFTLMLKGIILNSRISVWQTRLKIRRESNICSGRAYYEQQFLPDGTRVRDSTEFKIFEALIPAFKASLPKEFRDPFSKSTADRLMPRSSQMAIDPILYLAHILPHTATIGLHEPYADIADPHCPCRSQVLSAARSIVESVYSLSATSFDPVLLPPICIYLWGDVGHTLGRYYKYSLDQGKHQEAMAFRGELDVLSLVLGRVGERLPVAYRSQKLLKDLVTEIDRGATEQMAVGGWNPNPCSKDP